MSLREWTLIEKAREIRGAHALALRAFTFELT